MDRHFLIDQLALARQHVAHGQTLVERQEKVATELERDGHDADIAHELLRTLRQVQEQFEFDLIRLERAVADASE